MATQPTSFDINRAQRLAVISSAIDMEQGIFNEGIDTTRQTIVRIPLQNVGLIKRLIVVAVATVQNTHSTEDAVATPYGIANVISNFTFKDLNNNERINTNGGHISLLNSARHRQPFAASLANSVYGSPLDSAPSSYGNNFPCIVNPLTVIHGGGTRTFRMVWEIPLAYSDDDLRGAIYANVLNATMRLVASFNKAPFVANGVDDTQAVFKGGTVAYTTPIELTVYQQYLDQLPVGDDGKGGQEVILPTLDLSTIYELKESSFAKIIIGRDFPVSFANFRDFLSVFAVYNHSGDDSGHGIGGDINFWALQSANFTNLFNVEPLEVVRWTRNIMGVDFPVGTYYFSFRNKPINTTNYGNMQLVLNAITAGPNAQLDIWWEDFAQVATITTAGSLSGAGA